MDIEADFNKFLIGLFEKNNIKLEEDLADSYPLENDYYTLVLDLENYIENILKVNEQITKQKIIQNL